jgi:hypothetical protein
MSEAAPFDSHFGQPSAAQMLAQGTILLVRYAAESNGGGGGS